MSNNHYHKCLHIGDMRQTRNRATEFIVLCIMGTKRLVMICPECHSLLKKWHIVPIKWNDSRCLNRTHRIKRLPGREDDTWFEITTTYEANTI